MRGMSVPPTANPLPTTSCPAYRQSLVRPFARIYALLRRNELSILSCFLDLLIVDGGSECPLGTLSMLTCDYSAGLVLYSVQVLMSMFHFLLLFLSLMDPFPPLMIRPECCNTPPVQRPPCLCHLLGFPFVILDRYNALSCAMSRGRGYG